jgi:multimeric flavodoxin WrbA
MKEAKADVDIIYSKDLDIGDCRGCFHCWTNTPGKCIQDDDMTEVLAKIADSDILVIATPVYVDGMTGSLKSLLDRSIPLLHGRFELRDDHCRHPRREYAKAEKLALVSVSGFTEMDNFDPLIHHMKAISKNLGCEYVGSLLRPYAWMLDPSWERGAPVSDILEAIRQAGYELVSEGTMKEETLAAVARDIISRDEVIKTMQGYYGDK